MRHEDWRRLTHFNLQPWKVGIVTPISQMEKKIKNKKTRKEKQEEEEEEQKQIGTFTKWC